MGEKVYDWDLLTKATLADLQRIFPDCQLLDEGKQSIRLDFTYEVPAKDEDEIFKFLTHGRYIAAVCLCKQNSPVITLERIIDINFLNTDMEFKKFLFKYGNERYNYLHNLSKAMRIVYDQPSLKIESRNYMMKKIISGNEPVFVEDLVIDANDIMACTGSPAHKKEDCRPQ